VEHKPQSACGAQTSVRSWSTNLSPRVEHKRTEGYVIVSSAYGLMFELLPQKGYGRVILSLYGPGGRRDHMVVGFITTCAISAYHH
jgi:hypothetical protein